MVVPEFFVERPEDAVYAGVHRRDKFVSRIVAGIGRVAPGSSGSFFRVGRARFRLVLLFGHLSGSPCPRTDASPRISRPAPRSSARRAQVTVPLCAISRSSRTGRNPIRSTLTFQCSELGGSCRCRCPCTLTAPAGGGVNGGCENTSGGTPRAHRRRAHPLKTGLAEHPPTVDIVVAEDQQAASRRVAKPRRQLWVGEPERVRDIAEAQHQVVGSHRPLPLVQHPVAHCPRVRLRPPPQPLRHGVPQVQIRPDPDPLGEIVNDLDVPAASQQRLDERFAVHPRPRAARLRARTSCARSLRTGSSVPPRSSWDICQVVRSSIPAPVATHGCDPPVHIAQPQAEFHDRGPSWPRVRAPWRRCVLLVCHRGSASDDRAACAAREFRISISTASTPQADPASRFPPRPRRYTLPGTR